MIYHSILLLLSRILIHCYEPFPAAPHEQHYANKVDSIHHATLLKYRNHTNCTLENKKINAVWRF